MHFAPRRNWFVLLALCTLPLSRMPASAGDKVDKLVPPIQRGQQVFSAGHSFHFFMPPILTDIVKQTDIKEHTQIGLQAIGGSRVIQHWNVPDEKNKVKQALRTGKVDVLTLAPIHLPDEGIDNFVTLALEHNPEIRVTVQEFWLPFDIYDTTFKERPKNVDHDAPTTKDLRERHAVYFKNMDDHVRELNKKHGKQVVYVVPVGQAVIALRDKITSGKAPGLKRQSELFTDAIGHAKPALQVLVAYSHYAVIYRKTPVGLPMPQILKKEMRGEAGEELNRLLQELAWEAVIEHPLSGVR